MGFAIGAVVLWTAGSALGQQCDTFEECMAGMCQDGECIGVPLNGGTCDDGNACTANDTCVNGVCQGDPPAAGGTCDDFNDCTTNDVCTDVFGSIVCMGSAVEEGTRCVSNCGTCEPFFPGAPPPLICKPDATRLDDPCTPTGGSEELGPCIVGGCAALGVPGFQIAVCLPMPKTCPEDGNLCTGEFCNPETGECASAPLPVRQDCFPFECHRCVPSTGACEPANVGASCDDFNVCTGSTVCSATGACVAGAQQQTPTPTATPTANTPTRTATTPTITPTQGPCVGDCDGNGQVVASELVTGVAIALDPAVFDLCADFDLDGNRGVEVNELVAGVNSSVRGCIGSSAALNP